MKDRLSAHLVVIEGIDQSGKATQMKLLARRLRSSGFRTKTVSYPVYSSFSGREITSFLEKSRDYPYQVVHMLYSLNRWETVGKLKTLLQQSDYLIIDRYYPSNIAYGMARGLDKKWLTNLDRGLPRPDTVVLIDTPVEKSFERKVSGRDRNEKDKVFLRKVRKNYLKLAREDRWNIVKGSYSQLDVSREIWKIIKPKSKSGSRRLPRRLPAPS